MSKLNIHHLARIEGHGNVSIEVKNSKVKEIRLDVVEPARLFESMIVGRRYDEAPLATSRVCGICSANHFVTNLLAVEDALDITVSERTRTMRQLLVHGSFLQNHATALYVFAAPDFVQLPSFFPLAETTPEVVQRALRLKKLGNDLCTLVGGRAVHPITPTVGGFTADVDADALHVMAQRLRDAAADAAATAEFFGELQTPRFDTTSDMLALYEAGTYAVTVGEIRALQAGWTRPIRDYPEVIEEQAVANSNAKQALVDDKPFLVGPLARVNISWDELLPSARVVASKVGLRPVHRNIFSAHICRAIELVDAVDRCAMLAEELAVSASGTTAGDSVAPEPFEVRAGTGYGATEAPRGTLYHSVTLDDRGTVTAADIVTPTSQNLASIAQELTAYAPTVVDYEPEDFKRAVEMLIRSYDPCLSCAVH
ncbi:MAG: Ni/Fe hydrogenase subunit alpha [Coriobacteriia bacterium]|nr:Ni/Fe hydrogenase subunit alpha [Coriobacteriia bacterium]